MARIIERSLKLILCEKEAMVLGEALHELRRIKIHALATVNVELGCNSRVVPFTKEDFGVDIIDSLILRIGELD